MSEQPTDSSKPTDATQAAPPSLQAQFELERISRRAALRKFGFGAGLAALFALSGDDLARMAATKLKQNAGDNKLANQIADQFGNAGVAFAVPPNPCDPGPNHSDCLCCGKQKSAGLAFCQSLNCAGLTQPQCEALRAQCEAGARKDYADCCLRYHCAC